MTTKSRCFTPRLASPRRPRKNGPWQASASSRPKRLPAAPAGQPRPSAVARCGEPDGTRTGAGPCRPGQGSAGNRTTDLGPVARDGSAARRARKGRLMPVDPAWTLRDLRRASGVAPQLSDGQRRPLPAYSVMPGSPPRLLEPNDLQRWLLGWLGDPKSAPQRGAPAADQRAAIAAALTAGRGDDVCRVLNGDPVRREAIWSELARMSDGGSKTSRRTAVRAEAFFIGEKI